MKAQWKTFVVTDCVAVTQYIKKSLPGELNVFAKHHKIQYIKHNHNISDKYIKLEIDV